MVGEVEKVLLQLTGAGVRYLVVGGVAVVLHGYLRTTADLDLVIDLSPDNITSAVDVLEKAGFRPRPPVAMRALADAEQRRIWIAEKNLQVLSLWHPAIPGFELDLFVKEPFVFDDVYSRASAVRVGSLNATVVSMDDLIAMKRVTGRLRDQEDVEALLALQRRR